MVNDTRPGADGMTIEINYFDRSRGWSPICNDDKKFIIEIYEISTDGKTIIESAEFDTQYEAVAFIDNYQKEYMCGE